MKYITLPLFCVKCTCVAFMLCLCQNDCSCCAVGNMVVENPNLLHHAADDYNARVHLGGPVGVCKWQA